MAATKASLDKQLARLDAAAPHGHPLDKQLAQLDAASAPSRLGGPLSGKTPGSAAKRSAPAARGMTLKQAIAPSAGERETRRESGVSLGALGLRTNPVGLARAVKDTVEAVGQEAVTHPVRSLSKAAGTVKDIAKGAGGAAIGLPIYAVEHPLKTLNGEGATHIAERMLKGEAKRVSDMYGPSYRGDKGARGQLQKRVHEEGPLPAALDLATVAAPISSGLGRAARVAADAGMGGKAVAAAARATRERPALKVSPTEAAVEQKVRPSAAGAAGTAATDAARRLATKRATARAAKTGKPLRADRALLADGEVAPLTRVGADRKLRLAAATNETRKTQAAATRVRDQVTGDKGETLRTVRNSVPVELHPVVDVAKKLGIRDSEGAKAAIPARIAAIERDRAAALDKEGLKGKRDHAAEVQAQGADGELELLRKLEQHPEVFDNPAISAAADAEGRLADKSGSPREGLSPGAAALGRSENLGHGLGVKTAARQNAEAQVEHLVGLERAKAEIKTAVEERDKVRTTAQRVLTGARTDVAKAKARQGGLQTGMGGGRAGGLGVHHAEDALKEAQAAVDAKLGAATGRVQAAREAHKTLRAAGPDYGVRHGKVSTDAEFDAAMENVGRTIDSAPAAVVDDLKNWQHGVIVGQANKLPHAAEAYDHFAPVRDYLRAEHGDTVRMYRGTEPGFADDGRALTSWTLNKAMARDYGKVEERQVPVDDIVAALGDSKKMPAGGDYNEFIVRRSASRTTPLKKVSESPHEYERRVAEANAALHPNLVAPQYVPAGFEREGFRPANQTRNGEANPLAKKRHGTLDRLGRSETDYKIIERDMIAKLSKGAAHEWESNLVRDHGKVFANEAAFNRWATEHGLNADPERGRVDIAMFKPTNGVLRKDLAPVKKGKTGQPVAGADHGDYHATDAVVAFPTSIVKEIDDLHALSARGQGKIGNALRATAHYSQAILLGGSLGWFQFQRVNDLLASAVGGSLIHTHALNKALKGLGEDDRQLVHIFSGGAVSSAALKPNAVMELGRMKQLLDASPLYQRALNSRTPVGALLRANGGENPLTGLLRADQAITSGFRERQFVHNLAKFARENDARVAGIHKGFAPLADAFKTADMATVSKLLNDPASRAVVEDAAQQLYKVHGDWHNFTAAERRFGATAAFYGFLRYATRMALFTLPLGHPYMSLLLAQLGHMSAEDAKAIIGPDQPWGLGAIYNDDGTVAADFTRGNPLMSPLVNLDKPEDVIGLATPIVSIVASYITGTPIGLSNSAEGYIKQFTVDGDPANHNIGGFLGADRLRIALRQIIGLAAPIREWDKFDSQQQSDDSLPWSRRYLSAPESPAKQLQINAKNAGAESGVHGLLHRELPLVAPSSAKNLKTQGAAIAAGKQTAAQNAEMKAAKRQGARTPLGQANLQLQMLDLQSSTLTDDAKLKELDRQLKLLDARSGG